LKRLFRNGKRFLTWEVWSSSVAGILKSVAIELTRCQTYREYKRSSGTRMAVNQKKIKHVCMETARASEEGSASWSWLMGMLIIT